MLGFQGDLLIVVRWMRGWNDIGRNSLHLLEYHMNGKYVRR